MNLNAMRNLYHQLAFTALVMIIAILQFLNVYERKGAPFIGLIWAMSAAGLIVLFILLLSDRLGRENTHTYELTIVSRYKDSFYMKREDGLVRRVTFTEPELLKLLEPGQRIKLTQFRMSRIPVRVEWEEVQMDS